MPTTKGGVSAVLGKTANKLRKMHWRAATFMLLTAINVCNARVLSGFADIGLGKKELENEREGVFM